MLRAIILQHHYCIISNTCITTVATAMFLDRNSYTIGPTPKDLEYFAVHVTESRSSVNGGEKWLQRDTER